MIIVTKTTKTYQCVVCLKPIEGDCIILPQPWQTLAFHPDCAHELACELHKEVKLYEDYVLAPKPA